MLAQGDQYVNCEKINAMVDSIFYFTEEESINTRQLTPILYQSALEQNCEDKSKILTLAGVIYYNDGQLIKSKQVLEKADSIVGREGCQARVCVFTKLFMGLIEMQSANQDRAFRLFGEAEEISRSIGFYSGQIQSLINRSLIYNSNGDLNKAKEYLNNSISLIDSCESKEITGYAYLNLGHTLLKENNFRSALENYAKAEKIWKEISFLKGLYYLEHNYATYAEHINDVKSYELHLKKAISYMENDSIFNSSLCLVNLGYLYVDQNRRDEALFYLEKALNVNDGHNNKQFLELATKLINLYSKGNREDKIAEISQRIEDVYAQKLKSADKQEAKWKNKEFVLESKLIENEELRKVQKETAYKVRVRNLLLGLLAMLILLSFFLFISWSNSRKTKEQLRLEKLRSKISKDLHDDVGTMLAGISYQAEFLSIQQENPQTASLNNIATKSREAMSKMRDLIWAIDARNNSPLDLEIKMKDYLVEVFQNTDKDYAISNDIPSMHKISTELKYALYIIFKESSYNFIKHSDGDFLSINLSQNDAMIKLLMKDNGTEKDIKKSGQGLKNMKERTVALGGSYRFYYDQGYCTVVVFPVNINT